MATTITIGGGPITLSAFNAWPACLTYRFRGYSTLTLVRRGGGLPGLPDPWLGKPIVLAIGGVTYFAGDVDDAEASYTGIGWVVNYGCRDLKARCDRVPFTDSNTLTDTAGFNLSPDDPGAIPAREGRTVGQILTAVLTMTANATALSARGVGAYTSLTPPTLPAATVADLATLTVIPPSSVYVIGEKLFQAIEAFLRFWAPNYSMWIDFATGAIRFLDQRAYHANALAIGTDPIEPTPLRRSVGDCFQRVVVRGQPIAERKVVATSDGTLAEDFGYVDGSGATITNAAAKAAWTPALALQDKTAKSQGTCVCVDTLNVTVDPADAAQFWVANFWDQTNTGALGSIDLIYSVGTGISQVVSRRVVANGALTAGGTCNVQVDLALPATNYDKFKLYGQTNQVGWTWKRYKVVDATMAAAMAGQLTYPSAWIGAGGASEVMTSYPIGSVCYSASGSPPYNEWPLDFSQDPATAHVYFRQATFVTCGNHTPSDVRALLAINTGNLTAVYPPDSSGSPVYGGTSRTVEGLGETLTLQVGEWRDPINQAAMLAFAHDVFDSVSDSIMEGSVVYHGLFLSGLAMAQAVTVTGNGYTTGWEGIALPITQVELHWNLAEPKNHTTVMECSNRRAALTSAAFLRPSRAVGGGLLSGTSGWNPFGVGQLGFGQMAGMAQAGAAAMTAGYLDPTLGMQALDTFTADTSGYMDEGAQRRPRTTPEDRQFDRGMAAMDREMKRIERHEANKARGEAMTRVGDPEVDKDQAENARRARESERREIERRNEDTATKIVSDKAIDEHLQGID